MAELIETLQLDVPEFEQSTWLEQKTEALAYLADNTIDTPVMDLIMSQKAKYTTKLELANQIKYKADLYASFIFTLIGIKQQKEDELGE